uniref:Uncharacterized protein n=1 Tax=Pararge aegeria TaxID=116150 RepID=S4PW14_9NEOP
MLLGRRNRHDCRKISTSTNNLQYALIRMYFIIMIIIMIARTACAYHLSYLFTPNYGNHLVNQNEKRRVQINCLN